MTAPTDATQVTPGRNRGQALSDAEWNLIVPYMPPPKALGRPRTTALRDAAGAILYMLRSGCPWRLLPRDFPPRSTLQRYFAHWRDSGLWARINRQLLMATREAQGRNANPSAGIIDSQSVKTTESVISSPIPAACWSRCRFMVPASRACPELDSGDRDGAPVVLASVRRTFPKLRHVFADQAYSGPKLAAGLKALGRWRLEIVKRPVKAPTFEVLPRRWVVERTLA